MAETKPEFQARLSKELKDLDTKEMAQKGWNPNALRLYLKAAKDVVDSRTFSNAFTPTRGMHRVARNLGLGLDVERGKWIPKEQAMKKEQVNEWVQGAKLIELLVLALEEQNSVKVVEYVNKLLSFKISEALSAKRKTLAEAMFGVKSEGRASELQVAAIKKEGERLKQRVNDPRYKTDPQFAKDTEAAIQKLNSRFGTDFDEFDEDANEVLSRSVGAKSDREAGGNDELLNNPELGINKPDVYSEEDDCEKEYEEGATEPTLNPFRK